MRYAKRLIVLAAIAISTGCAEGKTTMANKTFGDDVEFLRKYTDVVLLSDISGESQVAVLPKLQGRVMTSTAEAMAGLSFGWLNRELIASGKTAEHINVYGGEDRFWIGPEGGQFSVFFKKGVPFDLEHWFTPAPIDTEPLELVSESKEYAVGELLGYCFQPSGSQGNSSFRTERSSRNIGNNAVQSGQDGCL